MIKCNKGILKKACASLMFELSDEQIKVLLDEFETISQQLSLMDEIEGIEKVEPIDFPFIIERDEDMLRDDEPILSVTREEALANSADTYANQIRVPKVVK